MTEQEIFEELKKLLCNKFGIPENEITMEADMVNDLGIDSFAVIELRYEFENKFKLKIENQELASIRIIKDAVKFIKNKTGE